MRLTASNLLTSGISYYWKCEKDSIWDTTIAIVTQIITEIFQPILSVLCSKWAFILKRYFSLHEHYGNAPQNRRICNRCRHQDITGQLFLLQMQLRLDLKRMLENRNHSRRQESLSKNSNYFEIQKASTIRVEARRFISVVKPSSRLITSDVD